MNLFEATKDVIQNRIMGIMTYLGTWGLVVIDKERPD